MCSSRFSHPHIQKNTDRCPSLDINNVGSMSLALSAKDNPDYDKTVAARWQAAQVSSISIMNCSGRLLLGTRFSAVRIDVAKLMSMSPRLVGLTSDSIKHYLKYPRSFCLSIVSFLFIVAQLIAINIQRAETLWIASALLGLSYGGIFGIFITLFIDWFGLRESFSPRWFSQRSYPRSSHHSALFGKLGTRLTLPAYSCERLLRGVREEPRRAHADRKVLSHAHSPPTLLFLGAVSARTGVLCGQPVHDHRGMYALSDDQYLGRMEGPTEVASAGGEN